MGEGFGTRSDDIREFLDREVVVISIGGEAGEEGRVFMCGEVTDFVRQACKIVLSAWGRKSKPERQKLQPHLVTWRKLEFHLPDFWSPETRTTGRRL